MEGEPLRRALAHLGHEAAGGVAPGARDARAVLESELVILDVDVVLLGRVAAEDDDVAAGDRAGGAEHLPNAGRFGPAADVVPRRATSEAQQGEEEGEASGRQGGRVLVGAAGAGGEGWSRGRWSMPRVCGSRKGPLYGDAGGGARHGNEPAARPRR